MKEQHTQQDIYEPLDMFELLHRDAITYWTQQALEAREKKYKPLTSRFEAARLEAYATKSNRDQLFDLLYDFWHNGMGIDWEPSQNTIFDAAVNACLAIIYAEEWQGVKAQKLKERALKRFAQELLISMGRRNGKTYSVSGLAATFFLLIPGCSIGIFSVSDRQSKLMMKEIKARIKSAWKQGKYVREEDYKVIEDNKENYILRHPSGAEQLLGSYPSRSEVRMIFFYFYFIFFLGWLPA